MESVQVNEDRGTVVVRAEIPLKTYQDIVDIYNTPLGEGVEKNFNLQQFIGGYIETASEKYGESE